MGGPEPAGIASAPAVPHFKLDPEAVRTAMAGDPDGDPTAPASRGSPAGGADAFASLLHASFEHAAVGLAHVGPEGQWQWVNPYLCQMLGYSRDELCGLGYRDITHPADLERGADLARLLLDGVISSFELEKRYLHKSGRVVYVHLTVSSFPDSRGRPHRFAVIKDLTAQKEAEAALEAARHREWELEEMVDTLLAGAPVAMGVLDRRSRWIRLNPALAELLGGSPPARPGMSLQNVAPGLARELVAPLARVFETGQPSRGFALRWRPPAWERGRFLADFFPVLVAGGAKYAGLVVSAQPL